MSLRTRLIIAFLILSVVPLSAVTLIWYISSVRTFERAAEREASETAADIRHRMELVTANVGRRMDRLFDESVQYDALNQGHPPAPDSRKMHERLEPVFGDTAALLDRLEFEPTSGESSDADSQPVDHPPDPRPAPGAPEAPRPPRAAGHRLRH